eukprot:scaffold17108_cov15-Tisochrysis_lutea.AAC.1
MTAWWRPGLLRGSNILVAHEMGRGAASQAASGNRHGLPGRAADAAAAATAAAHRGPGPWHDAWHGRPSRHGALHAPAHAAAPAPAAPAGGAHATHGR